MSSPSNKKQDQRGSPNVAGTSPPRDTDPMEVDDSDSEDDLPLAQRVRRRTISLPSRPVTTTTTTTNPTSPRPPPPPTEPRYVNSVGEVLETAGDRLGYYVSDDNQAESDRKTAEREADRKLQKEQDDKYVDSQGNEQSSLSPTEKKGGKKQSGAGKR